MAPDVDTAYPLRLCCHVRRVQVPVDHITLHKASRLGMENPMMLDDQDMRCTTGIMLRSITAAGWKQARVQSVKTSEYNAASEREPS